MIEVSPTEPYMYQRRAETYLYADASRGS